MKTDDFLRNFRFSKKIYENLLEIKIFVEKLVKFNSHPVQTGFHAIFYCVVCFDMLNRTDNFHLKQIFLIKTICKYIPRMQMYRLRRIFISFIRSLHTKSLFSNLLLESVAII